MDKMKLEGVENAIVSSTVITDGGDVLIGSQKITNIYYSAQYQDLKQRLNELEEDFSETKANIEEYPDNKTFPTKLLKIDTQRNAVQKQLDELRQEVIRLAEIFTKIEINTERLRLARQHFKAGDFPAAKVILDADRMGSELDALLEQNDRLQRQQQENQAHLLAKANEFLILAQLTALDFTSPQRFELTKRAYEQSLKAAHTAENTFAYAYFLQAHKQFNLAAPWYEEALVLYRRLAEANPDAYLPDVAMTLNNLAVLQRDKNQFTEAEAAFLEALALYRRLAEANPDAYLPHVATTLNNLAVLQRAKNQFTEAEAAYLEALAIRRRLAEANPDAYLPDVATTLNNLALLQHAKNQFPEAEAAYLEALAIRRRLAEANPDAYLPGVAMTLNNLANLQHAKNQFSEAEAAYLEALALYRRLAEANPDAYLPNVAMTLNNLANLLSDNNQFTEAEAAYLEALALYRRLAEANPDAYLPYVAMTTVNLSIFFLQSVPDKEKSLAYVKEAWLAALPFLESIPAVQNYAEASIKVVSAWGLDAQAYWQDFIENYLNSMLRKG